MSELTQIPLSLSANLQLYLRFSSNWNDSSVNAYNMTAVNTPTFVAGKYGNAGNFVIASSQEANRAVASMTNAIIATTQSWAFWINFPSLLANNYIMGRSTGGNWFIYGDSSGNVQWTSGLSVAHSSGSMPANEWHHVCFTYNSTNQTISSFLDGKVYNNNVSVTGSISGAGTNFAIGRIGDYAGYGTFIIDDCMMFNKELTQVEAQSLAWEKRFQRSLRPRPFAPGIAR